MGFKKYDGSTWQPITPKKLKGIPYTGTLPAVLTGTKAGYLHSYKIYGNTEQTGTPTPENPIVPSECGERTENLLNEMEIRNNASINQSTGAVITSSATMLSDYIRVARGQTYIIKATVGGTLYSENRRPIGLYDEQKIYVGSSALTMVSPAEMVDGFEINIPSTLDSDTNYIRVGMDKAMTNIMLNSGSTALPYIPYGYKLPLTSGSTPVDIYIGDGTLSTEEYVDSSTGMVYRMVSGTLTPVDPPIPFPQIPTTAGSTSISWAGSGLEPSEFDSIQEWVDIPTYTYTNGEWVEDN